MVFFSPTFFFNITEFFVIELICIKNKYINAKITLIIVFFFHPSSSFNRNMIEK